MDTPICDFVRSYLSRQPIRAHMPGHKGAALLGMEDLDITEFDGADSLYEAEGIIARSEANASRLFGCRSFYSTEGSSQCIRAMVYLAAQYAQAAGLPLRIAAGRNAHRVFLTAAAMLDAQVTWLYPDRGQTYLSCPLEPQQLDKVLTATPHAAVYVTSPDYLGNCLDIAALAEVAHRHGALLLVDNAHGAYLRFLEISRHPMDQGADICCDSAHKTLPALTGAAYLHISTNAPAALAPQAKTALALFGSTSPSYLILQSLDRVNAYLADTFPQALVEFLPRLEALRRKLTAHGYGLTGNEPMKITVLPKAFGYTGHELADILLAQNIFTEFHDPDHLVLMLTPQTPAEHLQALEEALLSIPRKAAISQAPPAFHPCPQRLTVRQAVLSRQQTIPAQEALGRILGAASVSCPPAVPIVVCGEEITKESLEAFAYYGIDSCNVIE